MAKIDNVSEDCHQLQGSLNFETVAELYKQSKFLESDSAEVRIDLQEVDRIDSAGIALLLAWNEQASKRNKRIEWLNIPEQMETLVKINRLESLFLSGS